MSNPVLMKMIAVNAPLCGWEKFSHDGRFTWSSKSDEKFAREIFRQLSHEAVVRLVAREYDGLPDRVRLELRDMCAQKNCSGSVTKNIQRLNTLLGGRLLREEKTERFINERVETVNGVKFHRRRVNEAAAAAQRKYAAR